MESSLFCSDITMSGKICSGSYYLFSDVFNLFTGSFTQLMNGLEEENSVLLYSDSGFFESNGKKKLRHPSLVGYADDLIHCLQTHNISNVTYFAHSVNGLVAFIAAARAPHLFNRLVLTGAFPCLQPDAETLHLCGLQARDADSLFDYLMKNDESNHCYPSVQGVTQLTHIFRDAFAVMEEEEAKALFRLLLAADCRGYLSDLSVPVIILQAASDRISTNETGYFMYRTIPNSQLVRIRAKGHLPQTDAPQAIAQAIKFFAAPAL